MKQKGEKVESLKSIQRRRQISLTLYEVGRRLRRMLPVGRKDSDNRLNTRKRKETIFVWSMLAVPILRFLVFWVYVNFDSILLAFRNVDHASGGYEYWTLSNFKELKNLFTQGNMGLYGLNTLKFWLLGSVWGIPHSILLTYVFHKKLRGAKVYRTLLYLPSIICGVALAGIFSAFISSNGVVGYVMQNVFNVARVPNWFQEEEFAINMLLFWNFFMGFAGSYILFSGAMANIDKELTEAAYMDGVTMWQEIWYLDIPLMWPTLSMTIITNFAGLFGASGPILLFTSSMESTFTFGYWIFDQVRVYQSYYIPATLGLCFTIIAFPVALLIKRGTEKIFTQE